MVNFYRHNGKEKDEHTGLYEYGQRYYAPWLCRFVSVDPIAEDFPQLSSYNYASNRPITARDLEGLQAQDEPSGEGESGGGAQTDANGNVTGEYVVKEGQGPTQIAKDLKSVHGVNIDWKNTIDDSRNQEYFDHLTGDERYDKFNKDYENLNLNPGDIIYFSPQESKEASGADDFVGPIQETSKKKQSSENDDLTKNEFDSFTLIPEFTANFGFGVGAKMNLPSEVLGFSANYASLTLVGWQSNDFYLAGKNLSEDSDVTEVYDEYGGFFGGYGGTTQNTYESSRSGRLLKSTFTETYQGFIQIKTIVNPIDSLIINQRSINVGGNFGAILMPDVGLNLILYSDTVRYAP